jgi:RimJ/RimL family protein N-acetyltransferase
MIFITTERLIIRNFSPRDGEDLFRYLSKEEVIRFEPYGVYSQKEAYKEAERRSTDDHFLAVQLKGGSVIGNLYLAEGEFETWELGYVFNNDYWKKGYALESVSALLDYAFHTLRVRRVIAHCNPFNENSWYLLERLGFRREGHLIKNVSFKCDESGNPHWQDTFLYGLLKEEWK